MSQIARRSFMGLSLASLAALALPTELQAMTPRRAGCVVKLSVDISQAEAAVAELLKLTVRAPDLFCERISDLADDGRLELLFDAVNNRRSTALAGETVILLKPSERFDALLGALRAGDYDLGIFVQFDHDSSSVGCFDPSNEERAPAESQGPAGVCPLRPQGDCDA